MNVAPDYSRVLERELPPGITPSLVQRWLREGDRISLEMTMNRQTQLFGPLHELVTTPEPSEPVNGLSESEKFMASCGVKLSETEPTKPPVETPRMAQDRPEQEEGSNSQGAGGEKLEAKASPTVKRLLAELDAEEAEEKEKLAAKKAIQGDDWDENAVAKMAMIGALSRTVWTGNDQFMFETKPGDWGRVSEKGLRRMYVETGMFDWTYKAETDEEARRKLQARFFEKAVSRVMIERKVDIVTDLAGYKEQILTHRGSKIQVIGHPEIIQPVKGEFPTIKSFLSDLLETEQQLNLFYGWLQTSYLALAEEERRPGPAIVLVGPKRIDKTGCKELIIRPILGNRNAEPLKNMRGNQFNSGIAGAESWEFDDISSTPDSKERKLFGDGLKRYTSTTELSVEGKFKDSFQSPPLFYRVSMYLNEEKQDLWALPQMTQSLKGKVIGLKAHKPEKRKVELPTTNAERKAFREAIAKELPAFVYWLVNEFEIPEELQDSSYGIAGWLHPEIAEKIFDTSNEAQLQRLVDACIFNSRNLTEPWEGKAVNLDQQLKDAAKNLNRWDDYKRACWYDGAFFDLLKKIKAMPNSRVSWKHTRNGSVWVWAPPIEEGQQEFEKLVRASAQQEPEKLADIDFTVVAA